MLTSSLDSEQEKKKNRPSFAKLGCPYRIYGDLINFKILINFRQIYRSTKKLGNI